MKKFDLILNDIYNSQDYANKGRDIRVIDQFVIIINKELYLTLIMEISDFNGELIEYEYSFYSVTFEQYIAKETDKYDNLVSMFPPLIGVRLDKNIGFMEKRRLTNNFYDLVDEIYETKNVTEDILLRYINYMDDMAKSTSEPLQKIYSCFKSVFLNNI